MRGLPAEERKNLILDQAQRLFVERGFAATTVEDILNRAGIAKGTLYHHFSGKEDIMRQLIARTTNVMRQKAEAAASSDAHPLEKFAEIVASARVQGEEAEMIEQLHHVENTDFHVLTMTRAIVALAHCWQAQCRRAWIRACSLHQTQWGIVGSFSLPGSCCLIRGFSPSGMRGSSWYRLSRRRNACWDASRVPLLPQCTQSLRKAKEQCCGRCSSAMFADLRGYLSR